MYRPQSPQLRRESGNKQVRILARSSLEGVVFHVGD